MRINHFFVAALAAAVVFTSCSKEDADQSGLAPGEKAKLTIKIDAPVVTRAEGVSTDNSDNKINKFVAFVFKGNGVMEDMIPSADGSNVQTTNVTTSAREVCVVANVSEGLFSSVTTKAELIAILGDLATSSNTAAQYSTGGGNVWASGSTPLTTASFTQAVNGYEASVSVALTFVSAKININVDNQMTNQGAAGALTINQVAILNAVSQTQFFSTGTSLIPTTVSYLSGISGVAFHNVPASNTVVPFLQDTYTALTGNHYYVFENNSDAYPVIATLVATFDGTTRYFPVHFNLGDAGCRVVRGNIYNINIKLTGSADPGDGDNPGTDDPTDPYVNVNMTVSVTVNNWIPNTINKEFH